MRFLLAMLLGLGFLATAACGAETPVAPEVGVVEQGLGVWPPRCEPRNCVAMCVTCYYDICIHDGDSVATCRAEMELCKDDCGECEIGRPGCPP